jgi:TP901 family phage tail tape measure protein
MAQRNINIRITIDNRDAINAARAQTIALKAMHEATDKQTHLQNGLTNSFLKGNLAARAISTTYLLLRDSLRFAVAETINFEHNLAKISAITGATGGVLSSLEKTIRGVAIATNQSQNEIARAALEMGKIGLSGKQVEDALGGIASLARALDEDVVRAGETVVAILNTYGIEARKADMVTNQLAYTVKASALDIESFGVAFSYVGGTAAAAGVKFEELQAAMDVLSNSGIKASTIGTQLRRIIADLSNANSDAAKVLGGRTLSSYNSLADALEDLANKNLSISDYTAIFGRTASSVAAILTKYTGNIRDLTKATLESEGALAPMTALMNTTLKSNIDGIKVAWAELTIEFSKSVGPLTKVVGLLKEGIVGFSEDLANRRMVKDFKTQDPKGFRSAMDEIIQGRKSGVYSDDLPTDWKVMRTQAFEKFKFAIADREWVDKTKANIQQEIMDILDKDFAKMVAEGKGKASDIPFAKGSEGRRRTLENMFAGESWKFYQAIPLAQAKLAQSLESIPTESGLPEGLLDKKKKEKPEIEFDPMDVFDRLQDMDDNGKTYEEKFWEKESERRQKAIEEETKKLAKYSEEYIKVKEKMAEFNLETSFAFTATSIAIDGMNGSINALAASMVGLQSWGNAFKGVLQQIAAQIIATVIRLLIFKAIVKALGIGTGGTGFIPTGGLTDGLLKSLGGTARPQVPFGPGFASGTDQIVRQPTAFIAGEAGAERVKVTPRAKMSSSEDKAPTIIIQGDVYDYERFARKVKAAQESNRRNFV